MTAWMAPMILVGQPGTPVVIWLIVSFCGAVGGCTATAFIVAESSRILFPDLLIKNRLIYPILICGFTLIFLFPILMNWSSEGLFEV